MVGPIGELLNYTLAFFFWMMLGRLALNVISMGRTTFVTEIFRKATFPVYWLVRKVTPSAVPDAHIPVLSLPLLLALRILVAPAV